MGIDAIQFTDDGTRTAPDSPREWNQWISATSLRNFVLDDPLLDWLKLYGEDHGFIPDHKTAGYDSRTDFTQFIFEKGSQFENAVVRHLNTLESVVTIAVGRADIRSSSKAEETFAAMRDGVPIIAQAILWNANSRTFGKPDLLIRSDALARMFPDAISETDLQIDAPDLGDQNGHYRIVDIKFATLKLLAGGDLSNSGSALAYKSQLFLYNRALGRLQGYLPPVSYLLGRSFEREAKSQTERGAGCMDFLAPVPQSYQLRSGGSLESRVESAIEWIRRVRSEGHWWEVLPEPSVPELYPNMGNTYDSPWTETKKQIAARLKELTLLWQVGYRGRLAAHEQGVRRWNDPACSPAVVGVTGPTRATTLQAVLDINRATDGNPVSPPRISALEAVWRKKPALEFFVDFETVSDLDENFSEIPLKGGQPLIFMIGCGHVEYGEWRFECFTAEELSADREVEVIEAWLEHTDAVGKRIGDGSEAPYVFHWSHAETSTLERAYNSAVKRHPDKSTAWSKPRWFDLLTKVMRAEPVVVRGAFGFGLKAIAQAMNNHGLVDTNWESGPTNGLGAMVGAWTCSSQCGENSLSFADQPLMREIANYNEVDCKVMMEVIVYLRANH